MSQYSDAELMAAARACTGQVLPDNWRLRGRNHLEGKCRHKKADA